MCMPGPNGPNEAEQKYVFSLIATEKKNNFAEISKNLARYNLKIILFDYQNNYVRNSSTMGNAAKNFDILESSI